MPELYIPPKELFFKLLGNTSKHVLYSRNSEPNFGYYEGPTSEDQWWSLIPGTGKYAGCYAIKSKFTGKFIFSRTHTEPRVGHIDSDGKYADNWFRLEPGTGKLANHFRLRNFSSDYVIVSRTNVKPHLANYPGTNAALPDQYFSFVFEDTEINRIEYKIDQGQILSATPEVLGHATQRNVSSLDQTVEFKFSQAQTISSTFEYAAGFSVTVGSSVKVGIPLVAEGELKVESSMSRDFKWGSSTSDTKTFESRFPATAAPHTQVVATSR